jgi:hypothetical protein
MDGMWIHARNNSEILDTVSEIEVIIDEADDVVLPGTSEETFLGIEIMDHHLDEMLSKLKQTTWSIR